MAELETGVIELFGNTADGVFAVDTAHRIMLWNAGAQRILGYTPRETIGKPCFQVMPGIDRSGHQVCGMDCQAMLVGKAGGIAPTVRLSTKAKDGRELWLSVTHIVVPSGKAGLSAMVHIFRDVSEEMERQQLLERLAQFAVQAPGRGLSSMRVTDPPAADAELTPREREVLYLLAQGKNARLISNELVISLATSRNHIQNILNKLSVHTALEAVAYASQHGLLGPSR